MIATKQKRNARRPDGVLLATVQGWSHRPGDEVRIVATNLSRASANRKTGDVCQVWTIPVAGLVGAQTHACGSCPLMPKSEGGQGGCYVTKLFITAPARLAANGDYPAWDGDISLFDRLHVRFGAWGDPCLIPLPIVERIARASRGWMGYTHEWHRPECQPYARYFMASVHSPPEAELAARMGWRWFLTPRGQQIGELPGRAITCPHDTDRKSTRLNSSHIPLSRMPSSA